MSAVLFWVRTIVRRRVGATIAIALLAGGVAGVVGVALQASRRAEGAVQRYEQRNRSYELGVVGCRPGVAPTDDSIDFQQVKDGCLSMPAIEEFRHDVLSGVPGIEGQAVVGARVLGILDPSSPNGWGRLILAYTTLEADVGGSLDAPLLVAGRRLDENAPDEVMIGSTAAARAGIHAGDVITIASWTRDQLDTAIDGRLAPTTETFTSRVVGIVRTLNDVQPTSVGDMRGTTLPDALFAGRAWSDAHAADLPGYGDTNAVRLISGSDGIDEFVSAVQARAAGRFFVADPYVGINTAAVHRVIDTERQALLVFALIATIAGMVLVGLTVGRQLRREFADAESLTALGMTSFNLAIGAVLRTTVAAALAVGISITTIVVASPFTPVGIARRLEYSTPVRLDAFVLVVVPCAMVAMLVVAAVIAALVHASTRHRSRVRNTMSSQRVLARSGKRLNAVARAGLGFADGASPRLAAAMGAVAIGFTLGANSVVASFDRVINEPARYGAWWDAAVGQYSLSGPYADAVTRVEQLPDVVAAAGFVEDSNTVTLDGIAVPYNALDPLIGDTAPIITTGRAPVSPDEVALGAKTARRLDKTVGDTVTLSVATGENADSEHERTLEVVGIAVLANPVRADADIGEGVAVHPELGSEFNLSVPQSIVVEFAQGVDRAATFDAVVRAFPGSARVTVPPSELQNLQRLRWVPWSIALLVAILALGSLVHAMVTMLQRHRHDLAVLAALGLTRPQRRRVALVSGSVVMGLSGLAGVPIGIVLGRSIWRVVAQRAAVPSSAVTNVQPILLVVLGALAIGAVVGSLGGRWFTRHSPGAHLRAE